MGLMSDDPQALFRARLFTRREAEAASLFPPSCGGALWRANKSFVHNIGWALVRGSIQMHIVPALCYANIMLIS